MIAAEHAGERDGARWRREHPTRVPTMHDVTDGWTTAGVIDTPADDMSPRAFAADAASFEAYRRGFCRGAGVEG